MARQWPTAAYSEPQTAVAARANPEPPQSSSELLEALTTGLGATARIVLYLAADLDVTFSQIAYTALWAPRVAEDMARRDSPTAFLSRDALSGATGLSGQKAMLPGGVAESAATTVGLVRMVARGAPGAVPRADGTGWRGEATSWTVTGDPAAFVHRPARTGEVGTAVPEPGRTPLHPGELDRAAVNAWADPRFCWWRGRAAGPTGLRLIATLLTRFGVTDVLLRTADVASLTGVHRQTAWAALRGLDRLGLARKEGKHGHWRVAIASHLAHLTGDDLKYLTRRPAAPGLARAEVHDWGWFTPQGRSMRQRARTVLADIPETTQEVAAPAATRTDARTGWLRGAVMGTIEMLRHCDRMGQEAARKAMTAILRPEPGAKATRERRAPVRPSAARWGAAQDGDGPKPDWLAEPAPAAAAPAIPTAPVFTLRTPTGENGLEILLREARERDAQAFAQAVAASESPMPPVAPQRPAATPVVVVPDVPGIDTRNLNQDQADWLARMASLLNPPQPLAE